MPWYQTAGILMTGAFALLRFPSWRRRRTSDEHRSGPRQGEPTVEIPFFGGKRSLTVYPEEVFTADDAAQLFFEWATTGEIDRTKHHLREFDLDAFYRT
jgi:hypothetical protein